MVDWGEQQCIKEVVSPERESFSLNRKERGLLDPENRPMLNQRELQHPGEGLAEVLLAGIYEVLKNLSLAPLTGEWKGGSGECQQSGTHERAALMRCVNSEFL